jgi:MFS family permease
MFRLLRRGPFALLWAGATVSTTGDAMSWVALVWLVYRQRGRAGDVAVLAAAYTAPVALGGLLAGRLLDRYDRRRLLAADNLVRAAAFATVPVAAAAGLLTLTHLYLVAACYGLLKMVSLAGFPALIPAYVDDADLQRANALEGLSFGASQAAGDAPWPRWRASSGGRGRCAAPPRCSCCSTSGRGRCWCSSPSTAGSSAAGWPATGCW